MGQERNNHRWMANTTRALEAGCHQRRANLLPAIDTETLFRHSMGNVAFAMALLDELESSGPHQVETIRKMSIDRDAETLREAAHALKGAAAIVGAEPLRSLAADIEQMAKSDDLEHARSLIEDLSGEMSRCLEQIPDIRKQATT